MVLILATIIGIFSSEDAVQGDLLYRRAFENDMPRVPF
jgi:hypothetical protein